jgi:FtsZ-interacting cell division protein YlmF
MARSFAKGIVNMLWGNLDDDPEAPQFASRTMGGRHEAAPAPEPSASEEEQPQRQPFWRPKAAARDDVVELRSPGRPQTEICYPRSYKECEALADHFKAGSLLIVDLAQVEEKERVRLVHFLYGVAYGRDGCWHRINELTFAFAPRHFELAAAEPRGERHQDDFAVPHYRLPE